ncbi:uncharacterized protein LOC144109966 [Amblyomma americanum]
MTTFGPLTNIPFGVMEHRIGVLESPGYHIKYPYGRMFAGPMGDRLKPPLYTGLTLRVFFYAPVLTNTEVKLVHKHINNQKWFTSISRSGDSVFTRYALGNGPSQVIPFGKDDDTDSKEFYSMGVQIDGAWLKPTFNREVGDGNNMKYIKENDEWYFYIDAGGHVVISIHASNELNTQMPGKNLGSQYFLNQMPLPVGSYAVFTLQFYTGTDNTFKIQLTSEKGPVSHTYREISLKSDAVFTVFVRNVPSGWLIHCSFDKTAQLMPRGEDSDLLAPVFPNATIRKVCCVCGLRT